MSPVLILGFVAAAISMVGAVPQTVRILRSGRAVGVSAGTWLLGCASALAWISYGLLLAAWPQLPGNAVAFLLGASVLVLGVRSGDLRVGGVLQVACLLWLLVLMLVVLAAPALIGVLAVATGAPGRLPQLRTAWLFARAGREPSGVAGATFALSLCSSSLWAVYGVLAAQPAVTVLSVWSVLCNATVLMMLRRARAAARGLAPVRGECAGSVLTAH